MRDMGNYGSKMSETREVIGQGGTNPDQDINQEEELFKSVVEYHVTAVTEHIQTKLPKVFIDGHSLVKVALVKDFVNCGKYVSRSGLTFEGCTIYNNGSLTETRGIYYILDAPIYYFSTRRKISRDENEMQQIILNHVRSMRQHLKVNRRLLVSYNNNGISVFDKFVKGKVIKYPKSAEQGHLFISWVPRVPMELQYEKVNSISVYNHLVELEKEVVKFNITSIGGQAELIYNNTDTHIRGIVKSPDHQHKEIELMHGSFYLFSHPRPVQRRGID